MAAGREGRPQSSSRQVQYSGRRGRDKRPTDRVKEKTTQSANVRRVGSRRGREAIKTQGVGKQRSVKERRTPGTRPPKFRHSILNFRYFQWPKKYWGET